ncbi:hypothetical protein MAR_001243 [Mya arenaria]|uniref:Uncharacterized protein n=1 Tax=Mya arenaria TaxID=6604 RepID=A0ABY7FB95_MYAAR|nr:hypothetical protein MAR_001243 [Mya arenaria]
MKTGLRLMFARRFWYMWTLPAVVVGSLVAGNLHMQENYKEAYAFRGQSNLFREDAEKLKRSGNDYCERFTNKGMQLLHYLNRSERRALGLPEAAESPRNNLSVSNRILRSYSNNKASALNLKNIKSTTNDCVEILRIPLWNPVKISQPYLSVQFCLTGCDKWRVQGTQLVQNTPHRPDITLLINIFRIVEKKYETSLLWFPSDLRFNWLFKIERG